MTLINDHRKKPITASAETFFRRLFPISLFDSINKLFDVDKNRKKTKLRTFCFFIIIVMVNNPHDTSLRGIETMSMKEGIQSITGQPQISHTTIADRIRDIPSTSLEMVMNHLISEFKKRLKYKSPFIKGMKVFDVTTFSVSAKNYKWAARRQSRANIRFLFVMDSYSGTPDAIVDASKNLNDNKVFKTAISSAKNGNVFVFDKGFNSFQVFQDIVKAKKHFITRWKTNYCFEKTLERKLNPNEKLEGNWILESDEIGHINFKSNKEKLEIRKITCRNTKDNSTFVIMTDERNWAANKIVTMYVYRWPIEVIFRHIKTNLNVMHFPSHDPQGVRNWMLFVILSLIFVQLMTLDDRSDYTISLMARNSKFKPLLRKTQIQIDAWIIIAVNKEME